MPARGEHTGRGDAGHCAAVEAEIGDRGVVDIVVGDVFHQAGARHGVDAFHLAE